MPPYPGKVVDAEGKVLFEKADILAGQNIYQRYGLMDQGAVWGHGSQRGPEFSAASLQIIAEAAGEYFSRADYQKSYYELDDLQRGLVDVKTVHELKPNHYDPATDTLILTAVQTVGLENVRKYWDTVFSEGQPRFGFFTKHH